MKFNVCRIGTRPGLYLIEDFLSARECAALIAMTKKKGMVERVYMPGPIEDKSSFMSFKKNASKTVLEINKRISELTKFPIEYAQRLFVVRYDAGGKYPAHNDYLVSKDRKEPKRIAQILIYLNDVEEGGETYFTNLGIKFVPKRGRALFWYGVRDMQFPEKGDRFPNFKKTYKEEPFAVHSAVPVVKGEKWVAAKMLLDRPFDESEYPANEKDLLDFYKKQGKTVRKYSESGWITA